MTTTELDDGLCYENRLNALQGEPGGGKTWMALYACAEAIKEGEHVIFIDLEDHAGTTCGRMQALGCTEEAILAYFHYVRPSCGLDARHVGFLHRKIVELGVALVVIDSIGELMAMENVKPNDDDAVARLYRDILRPIADLGPGVILLDHVPKNNEHAPLYAIGSQRKKAAIDGAAFMVETVKPFSADRPGKLVLRTAKDRVGNFVVGAPAAEVEVVPSDGGRYVAMAVKAPEVTPDGSTRRTGLMSRVSNFLAAQPARSANRSAIKAELKDSDYTSQVLETLLSEGWVTKREDGRSHIYTLVHPFDPLADTPAAQNF